MEDKMNKTRLRWFDHVQRRIIDAVRKTDTLEVISTLKETKT